MCECVRGGVGEINEQTDVSLTRVPLHFSVGTDNPTVLLCPDDLSLRRSWVPPGREVD